MFPVLCKYVDFLLTSAPIVVRNPTDNGSVVGILYNRVLPLSGIAVTVRVYSMSRRGLSTQPHATYFNKTRAEIGQVCMCTWRSV